MFLMCCVRKQAPSTRRSPHGSILAVRGRAALRVFETRNEINTFLHDMDNVINSIPEMSSVLFNRVQCVYCL